MNVNCKPKLFSLLSACWALAALFVAATPASAVVIVGGDNSWEVSFDGNVNGFLVYEDSEATPSKSFSVSATGIIAGEGDAADAGVVSVNAVLNAWRTAGTAIPVPNQCTTANLALDTTGPCKTYSLSSRVVGGTLTNDANVSRVRTGLLPAFFSFNVRSPEVSGLRGSARISFAPQIQNANTKNQFGAQIDLREVFFNIDGAFGTLSVGRTLSLFQRQNILSDMTLFGVGVNGTNESVAGSGGTTLGRIGYGYVYPQFNARISYKTPNVNGFQVEAGIYDPSKICGSGRCASATKAPRLETELTYATSYDYGTFKGWFGAMWQKADGYNNLPIEVTAWGISGGAQASYSGFEVTVAGYTGKALGSVLMLDTDSLDAAGKERDNYGYYVQGTYSIDALKLGVSYGQNNTKLTSAEKSSAVVAPFTGLADVSQVAIFPIARLSALTFGGYYDVTSWFKLIAEYSHVTNKWHSTSSLLGGNLEQSSNVFSVGSFFFW